MVYKILFAGIDGSGKSACLDLFTSRLESKYSIIKIGNYDPYIYFKCNKTLAIKHKFYNIIDRICSMAKKFSIYGFYLILNHTYKVLLARHLERLKRSDIIMFDSDLLLHPAIYITLHFPFVKIFKTKTRFKLVSLFFGRKNNSVIVYLDVDPEVAITRMNNRPRALDAHENIKDLRKIRKQFDSMLDIASDDGFAVVRINTNDKSLNEVVNEVQGYLGKNYLYL